MQLRPLLTGALLLGGTTARAQEVAAAAEGPSNTPSDVPSLFVLNMAALAPFAAAFPTAQATETPAGGVAVEEERWSSFLPLMKDEALARGYVLPLPFGAGATFTVLSGRDIRVRDLSVRVNNEPERSVSHIVDLGSESDVFNANLKLDAWILPFLNVYALAGYVYNESKTHVHVSVPSVAWITPSAAVSIRWSSPLVSPHRRSTSTSPWRRGARTSACWNSPSPKPDRHSREEEEP
jgi:hypothetical protein